MNSRFIIIAILIFIKVIGVASHARADFSYLENIKMASEDRATQWKKEVEEMLWRPERERRWEWLESEKTPREETIVMIITNIDDHSYTVDYLNGKKEYCIRNDFETLNDLETLNCVDYSQESNKKTFNKKTNGKISKDEESEMKAKEELILSMTLSTLFNIT